jgi:hypothetical protein
MAKQPLNEIIEWVNSDDPVLNVTITFTRDELASPKFSRLISSKLHAIDVYMRGDMLVYRQVLLQKRASDAAKAASAATSNVDDLDIDALAALEAVRSGKG